MFLQPSRVYSTISRMERLTQSKEPIYSVEHILALSRAKLFTQLSENVYSTLRLSATNTETVISLEKR